MKIPNKIMQAFIAASRPSYLRLGQDFCNSYGVEDSGLYYADDKTAVALLIKDYTEYQE